MLQLIILFLFAYKAIAGPTLCIESLNTAVSQFTFASDDPDANYYTNICTNNFGVHTLWLAAKLYCTPKEFEAGPILAAGYCSAYGMVELTPYSAVENDFTDEYIKSLKEVYFEDINATKVWNESLLISKQLYEDSRKTNFVFDNEYKLHSLYGWAIYGFWGGLLVLGMLNRFVIFIIEHHGKRRHQDIETITASRSTHPRLQQGKLTAAYTWFRTHLVIPAAFGSKHRQLAWTCSIPTRLESVVIISFWALNIIIISVSYDVFGRNLYYNESGQIWRYLSDRTGVLAYANLPFLWMFAGRNNIFLWATGWSFATFNTFHRDIARVAVLEAIIHSVGYSVLEAHEGYFYSEWKEQYWYMGALATIAMSFLLVFSSIYLRQRLYEFFLLVHIALSIVTIVALFFHTKIFDGEYDPYLWPLVAIWCFDRFMRVVRVVYCNLHIKLSGKPQATKAVAAYRPDSDLIRLDIFPGSKFLTPKPNQHYFLYQYNSWKGWENHPFSLASWSSANTSTILTGNTAVEDISMPEAKSQTQTSVSQASASSPMSSSSTSLDNTSHHASGTMQKLTFLIRPSTGWTKRLRDACLKQSNLSLQTHILLEGPYGHTVPLNKYEDVLFITGGTGIATDDISAYSCATAYLQEYCTRVAANLPTSTTRINLIWAAKQNTMIQDVATNELRKALKDASVTASFHITSHSLQLKELEPKLLSDSTEHVHINRGRPDVKHAVLSFIDEVHGLDFAAGKTAVLVCGPAAMADAARSAVHLALKDGRSGVDYFEETFGW